MKVSATCDCECDALGVPQPFIPELVNESVGCAKPVDDGEDNNLPCVDFVCAKCGQILECYVDSGNDSYDADICAMVKTESTFCPVQSGSRRLASGDDFKSFTTCGQQCDGAEKVECFTGKEKTWSECPAGKSSKCQGGNVNGAGLSNFAGYTYCPKTPPTCGASPSCVVTGSSTYSYTCTADADGCKLDTTEGFECIVDKCDVSGDNSCSCPANF